MRLLLLFLLASSASAQPATNVAAARQTILANAETADSLLAARARLQIAPDDAWAAYYTALADYRLAYVFWASDAERALQHAGEGAEALVPLVRNRSLPAEVRAEAGARRAALLSAQIGLDPSRSMSLGAETQRTLADAARLGPDNPRVLLVRGIALQSTPPEWGGDPEQARATLQRAADLFQAEPDDALAPRWGHGEAYAWIAMSHLMNGDAEAARPAVAAAERLDPNSGLVRYKLRPWLDGMRTP